MTTLSHIMTLTQSMIDTLLRWTTCSDEDVYIVKRALLSKDISDDDVRTKYTFRVTEHMGLNEKTNEIYAEHIIIEVKFDGFMLYDIIIHCRDMIVKYGM